MLLSPSGMSLGSCKTLAPSSASILTINAMTCAPVQQGGRGSEHDFRVSEVICIAQVVGRSAQLYSEG